MVIKSRRMRWAAHVARMKEIRNVYGFVVGRPEEKRPLRRPGHRWKHIRIYIRGIHSEFMD